MKCRNIKDKSSVLTSQLGQSCEKNWWEVTVASKNHLVRVATTSQKVTLNEKGDEYDDDEDDNEEQEDEKGEEDDDDEG